mgnify:FL=1
MSEDSGWADEGRGGGCWPFVMAGLGGLIAAAAVLLGSVGWAGRLGGRAGGGRRG